MLLLVSVLFIQLVVADDDDTVPEPRERATTNRGANWGYVPNQHTFVHLPG